MIYTVAAQMSQLIVAGALRFEDLAMRAVMHD